MQCIDPLGYRVGGVNMLKECTMAPPISAFIVDIAVLPPPQLAFDMEVVAKIVGWAQASLLKEDITLTNRGKSKFLFPGRVEAGDLSADRRADLRRMDLTAAGRGVRLAE